MIPIITTRSYELVRDRIAEILASELPNQSTLHGDANLNAGVFIDRIVPIDSNETPIVNIIMGSANWDNFTQTKQDGTYTYDIDIYVGSKGSATESGDVISMSKLQKLAGVVQGILMHPNYVTLGFARPFIEHREVSSASLGVPNNTLDATNTTQCRIQLLVRVPEHSTVDTPPNIEGWDTQVKLGLTEKGYIYSGDNIPIPEPVCEVTTFVYNSDNDLLLTKVVSDEDNVINIGDSLIQLDGADGLELISNLPSTNGLILKVTNEDLEAIQQVYVEGNNLVVEEQSIFNSDATYSQGVDLVSGSTFLPNVDNIDSDGTVVSTPAMTPFICTPQDNTITMELPFIDTDVDCSIMFTANGLTTFTTLVDSNNIGTLTYSTDEVTYIAFTLPFTPIVSTPYYFRRSDTTSNANYTISD